ncbi:hypothetical protein ATL10_10541, partial [Bacillus sp. 196mf]
MKKFIPKVLTTAVLIGLIGEPIIGSPLTTHAAPIKGTEKPKEEKEKREKEKEKEKEK